MRSVPRFNKSIKYYHVFCKRPLFVRSCVLLECSAYQDIRELVPENSIKAIVIEQ